MKKLIYVLLLLALVLSVVPAAFAQDTLSQEDLDAVAAAYEATFSATSMSFDFTVSLAVTGMSESGDSDMSADITGSGAIALDPDNPLLTLDVTGSAVEGGDTTPLNASVRIVDGNVYLSEDGESWQYMSLDDVMSMLESELSSAGVPLDPSMLEGDLSSLGDMTGMSDMMAGLEDMQPSDFLTLTQDGNTYTFSLDIAALISSPALAPMIAGSMGSTGTDGEMTDAQMQQMTAMLGAMFSDAVVELSQDVDPDSGMLTSMALNVNIPLDIVSPGAGITLNFILNLSNFDEPVDVVAPEGAEPASM